jgi:hypothetical protein
MCLDQWKLIRITHRHTCSVCGKKVSGVASAKITETGEPIFRHAGFGDPDEIVAEARKAKESNHVP